MAPRCRCSTGTAGRHAFLADTTSAARLVKFQEALKETMSLLVGGWVGDPEQLVTDAVVLLGTLTTHRTNYVVERGWHRRGLLTR